MRFEFYEETNFKDTEIGPLPVDWEVMRLGEVAEVKQGKTPKREDYADSGGYRIVKVKDFDDGGFIDILRKGERSYVKSDLGEAYTLKFGDVLVLSAGHSSEVVGQKIGFFSHVPEKNEKYFFVAELLRVRAKDKLVPYFAFGFLNTPQARRTIRELVKGGHLYARDLATIQIPLPPLEEQKQIAQILQAIDKKIEKEENYKKALQNLFKSLLHNLMSGKIRVRRV